MSTIKGLTSEQTNRLQDVVRQRESGNNYAIENQYGYIGGYQFGAQALQEQGLIKKGLVTDYAKLGNTPAERAEAHKALLNDPANWTNEGGKEAFLNNPQLQDEAFNRLANQNYSYLSKKGVIDGSTPAGDVGGYLTAAHLKGAGNAAKLANGTVTRDANGTSTSEYFALGKGAVTGAKTAPGKDVAKVGGVKTSTTKITTAGNRYSTSVSAIRQRDSLPVIGIVPNVLEKFVSFDCIFTLSCLNDSQVNFPDAADSYKSGNLGQIICRGGSGFPSNRVSTAYTSEYNKEGKFEFYIDNVQIESIMSYNKKSKGTNSTNITFDIYEPYSMGIFLQSMQLAAASTKHKNYIEAPFLLTMQFIGRDENGEVVPVDDMLDRHIPIKIANSNMTVTASGCTYNMEAIPWNEQGFMDSTNLLKQDLVISGTTVSEIIQTGPNSLQAVLNKRLEEQAKQGSETGQKTYTRDEIVILFPTQESMESQGRTGTSDAGSPATVAPGADLSRKNVEIKLSINREPNGIMAQKGAYNKIGSSSMGFDINHGGNVAQKDTAETTDAKTGTNRAATVIDHKNRSFSFAQGTSVINAISEIIVMSEYCKSAATSEAKETPTGFKPWFRVECQVYNLTPEEGNEKQGRIPKLYVYNVVEYDVHSSRFQAPTSEPKGIDNLKKEIVKEYNYIYSGKNTDILNFNIKLEHSAFTTVYSDKLALSSSSYGQVNGVGLNASNSTPTANDDAPTNTFGVQGTARQGDLYKKETTTGGGPSEGYRELVAKTFQEALLNSPTDLITAEMEILGDPYYIADSGMGNFGDKLASFNMSKNGSMNYQSGEVDILVNFKTPIDYNPLTGQIDFGSAVNVDGFSGLYQVMSVKNSFVKGKFTQVLDLTRRANQKPAEPPTTSGAANAAEVKDEGAPATASANAQPRKAVDSKAQGDGQEQMTTIAKPSEVPGGP